VINQHQSLQERGRQNETQANFSAIERLSKRKKGKKKKNNSRVHNQENTKQHRFLLPVIKYIYIFKTRLYTKNHMDKHCKKTNIFFTHVNEKQCGLRKKKAAYM